jgi:hypothetical protein
MFLSDGLAHKKDYCQRVKNRSVAAVVGDRGDPTHKSTSA